VQCANAQELITVRGMNYLEIHGTMQYFAGTIQEAITSENGVALREVWIEMEKRKNNNGR
jgi:hypothetical protein